MLMQNRQSCDTVFCDSLLASIGDWFDCAMCQMFVFGICLLLASACLLQFLGHSLWVYGPLGPLGASICTKGFDL